MKKINLFLFLAFSTLTFAQEKVSENKFKKEEITVTPLLIGDLYTPNKVDKKTNLVILIAGSGPTDRNGNQTGMSNNSLKYTAEGLAQNGIATFSYDKRIIAQMKTGSLDERSLKFDDFINDAKTIVSHFKNQKKYNHIIVAGHSEGSLIGMVASSANVDGFISLSGAGRTIDLILEDQIAKQAPSFKQETHDYLQKLKNGETFELKNQMLASVFRESVQPYMISWIKYNPQEEIQKLKIPVMIINGSKDIQVEVSEAELLKKAKPEAKLEIIENMNHIFKIINGNMTENMGSYTNPNLPVAPALIEKMTQFVSAI